MGEGPIFVFVFVLFCSPEIWKGVLVSRGKGIEMKIRELITRKRKKKRKKKEL